ncbi:hypothetical protein GCM10022403_078950 [Streptomyces coacervatus]|uniref:HTH cro/C1-type domain-containing protein n=2 Tax=Streptomyces coacervatus TaxID=647381 RepID=A0ABP7J5H6_9ACTN
MPDQRLSATLPGLKPRGGTSKSCPDARTDAIGGSGHSSWRSPDAALAPSSTEHAMSAARNTPTQASGTRICKLCRCRLSRYNKEDVCSGCTRENQPTARSIPIDIWQLPDVRQALINREFGHLCQLIRQHGGVRQDDIAALTDLSQPFLSMLESGARKLTNIDKIVQLLDGLQAPPELTGPMLRPNLHHPPAGSTPTSLSRS